jgi:hypothetical protein
VRIECAPIEGEPLLQRARRVTCGEPLETRAPRGRTARQRCAATALCAIEALTVAPEKLGDETGLKACLDAGEPLAVRLRVGVECTRQSALDGIEALARQSEKVFKAW